MKLNKIHEDERGEIYTITDEKMKTPEITLLVTNKGFARGGCIHELRDEFCVCVEGIVEYYAEGTNELSTAPQHKQGFKLNNLHKGKPVLTPHGIPHYFYSKTDSIVLEFGAKIEDTTKHHATRDFIDEMNKKVEA